MVTVSKMAKDTGLPLAGARFKLTGPRGKNPHGYGKELVTDENGILSFDGLDYGVDYTLRETAAPKGYALDPTEHKVQVKDDSEPVKNLRFYNRLSTANIKLLKTDGDGRPLSGVRFGLCDLLGKCVVLPDSDSGGLIGFSVVRGREYVLRELDTVAGYALLPQPVRFGVDGDGAVSVADGGVDSVSVGRSGGYSVLRVVNYRQGRVPLSGGFGFYWFVLPGCLVLAAGVFVLFKFKREGELG